MKKILVVLAGLLFAVSSYGQGLVNLNNSGTSRVIDGRTGAAAAQGVYVAGLYYSTDLNQAGGTALAPAAGWTFIDASVTPVTTSPLAALAGLFSKANVPVPNQPAGSKVVLQARVWSVAFPTYEEALANPAAWVGISNVMGAGTGVTLGGGTTPVPSTSSFIQTFTTVPVPEPSTVVLGVIGALGALSLLRRRQ